MSANKHIHHERLQQESFSASLAKLMEMSRSDGGKKMLQMSLNDWIIILFLTL